MFCFHGVIVSFYRFLLCEELSITSSKKLKECDQDCTKFYDNTFKTYLTAVAFLKTGIPITRRVSVFGDFHED